MVFWLVNVQIFLYTRAQIDTPAGLEAHYARNKTSSWHLNRFPDADNIGSTV